MRFPDPLLPGRLVRRYKRFLADVELADTGAVVTAHCANPGSMLSVDAPGSEVWLSPARNPDRKLKYTWEMIRVGRSLVGINTALPNGLVQEAIENGRVPELKGYASLRREVRYGESSRIDLLLEDAAKGRGGAGTGKKCYVEVKNVTMKRDRGRGRAAEFPDAVTARGAKHLAELSAMAAAGHRAVMFFLVQRQDAGALAIADDVDPAYAEALRRALDAGVEVLCYGCRLTTRAITVAGPLPARLPRAGASDMD